MNVCKMCKIIVYILPLKGFFVLSILYPPVRFDKMIAIATTTNNRKTQNPNHIKHCRRFLVSYFHHLNDKLYFKFAQS